MRFIEKVRNWTAFKLGLKTYKEVVQPFRKIDPDEHNWMSFGTKRKRDLSLPTQDWITDVAYYQWLTDPLAGRLVEIICDFSIGEGVSLKAEDEDVQALLDEFWFDEINNYPEQQVAICMEYTIFGELVCMPFVNPMSGIVRYARIDPTWIKDVVPMAQFPQMPATILLKTSNITNPENDVVNELKIIQRDDMASSPTAGKLVGDAFYFHQNKIANKRRGHTQFLRTHEWIDIYNKRMFNEAERQELANAYVWDVVLKGASDQQIQEFLDSQETPQNASIRAHNENVEWNVLTPDLKSTDFSQSNRQFLQLILGAFAIPEHFFALGGEVNFATAKAMAEPTLRAFRRQQRQLKSVFEKKVDYQIEKAQDARRIRPGIVEYDVIMDEVNAVDMAGLAGALSQFSASLQTAENQRWLSRKDSAEAFAKLFSQSGVDVQAIPEGQDIPPTMVDAANAMVTALESRKKKNRKYA